MPMEIVAANSVGSFFVMSLNSRLPFSLLTRLANRAITPPPSIRFIAMMCNAKVTISSSLNTQ